LPFEALLTGRGILPIPDDSTDLRVLRLAGTAGADGHNPFPESGHLLEGIAHLK